MSMVVDSGALVMTISGSAESDAVDELSAFITAAHEQADREQVVRVVTDLRELEFATSSSLKVFATWLLAVAEQPARMVVFRTNPKHSWQRRSLSALAACAPGQVEIKAES